MLLTTNARFAHVSHLRTQVIHINEDFKNNGQSGEVASGVDCVSYIRAIRDEWLDRKILGTELLLEDVHKVAEQRKGGEGAEGSIKWAQLS